MTRYYLFIIYYLIIIVLSILRHNTTKYVDSIYDLKNLMTIIRDVYGLHLRKWKWKNPGFTARVLLQFLSLDGNRNYIDENSGFSKYDCST